MTKIKFRAWQTSNEKPGRLLYDVVPLWEGEALSQVCTNNGRIDGIVVAVESVEQFTGLKDKNGVDVYEGDVIRYSDGDQTVEWRGGEWGFSGVMWANKGQIVGNIHESPELLEKK